MVTTRSADKRLDPSREEDLVLRSRRIGSPKSVASTPSQASKRTANAIGTDSSPRVKRAKSGLDNSVQNAAFHVVVNVPVKNAKPQPGQIAEDLTKQVEVPHDSDPSSRHGKETIHEHQTTPTSGQPMVIMTPPAQANETFRTPATSRHKRFDSEDIDDDTIMVSTTLDSTAPQGYQTAEEEIGDSDDDAPEVQSIRTAPHLPHGKLGRTPKTRRKPEPIVSTPSAALAQTTDHSSASEEVIDSAIAGHDESRGETANSVDLRAPTASRYDLRDESLSQSTGGPDLRIHPGMDTEDNLSRHNLSESPSISDGTVMNVSANQESVQLSYPIGQDFIQPYNGASMEIALATKDALSPRNRDLFAYAFDNSRSIHAQDTNVRSESTVARLPLKSNSSLSAYRKDKMQQRVAGSAGGLGLQNDWSKKRSSFVLS